MRSSGNVDANKEPEIEPFSGILSQKITRLQNQSERKNHPSSLHHFFTMQVQQEKDSPFLLTPEVKERMACAPCNPIHDLLLVIPEKPKKLLEKTDSEKKKDAMLLEDGGPPSNPSTYDDLLSLSQDQVKELLEYYDLALFPFVTRHIRLVKHLNICR